MTPQEKDLLTQLSDRLRKGGAQQKDPEAEALIRQTIAAQPDAPYMLAQTVLIQDFALSQAQGQIAQLQQQLAAAKSAQAAQPAASGGFLSSLFGRSERPAQPQSPPAMQQGGPWNSQNPNVRPNPGYAPQAQAYAPQGYGPQGGAPQGGPWGGQAQGGMFGGGGMMGQQPSFLRSAATTALGIAGGAMLFQGVQSMFGHSSGGLIGSANAHEPSLSEQAGLTPGYGAGGGDYPSDAGGDGGYAGQAGYDQAGYDQGNFDQGGNAPQDTAYDPGYAPQSDVQDTSWSDGTQDSGWGGDSSSSGGDDWV